MNKTVVALLGIALLVSPAIPSLAEEHGEFDDRQAPSSECPEAFEGEHWALAISPELPGATNVSLVEANTSLAQVIRLPGDELACDVDDDRVRLATDDARLRVDDREELRLQISIEDNASAAIELAADVEVEPAEDRYRLTPEGGPTLMLAGDNLTLDGDTIHVEEGAFVSLAREQSGEERSDDEARAQPDDARERSRGDDGAGDRGQGEDRPDEAEERPDRSDRQHRAQVTEGEYTIGSADVELSNDTLHELTWRNVTVLRSVEVPGLTPAEERLQGPQLRLDGEDARVRLAAAGGLMVRMESDEGLEAELNPDLEVEEEGDHVLLASDEMLVVLEGDDVELRGNTVVAEELRLHARAQAQHESPTWQQDRAQTLGFPHAFEGRYVAFELTEDRLGNISVHGTPIGEVRYDEAQVSEVSQRGANFEAEGEDLELRVQDTPAVQLRLEATNLTVDLPERTTLPSGAQVHVQAEDDELRLRVDRPADALANRTVAEHQPPSQPLERTEGPTPGLQAESDRGELGVESTNPSTITTSFETQVDELDANVSVELGLARAMLIDDTNGNNRVDVGEPALAESSLNDGNVSVEDDALVHRFPLWSGNLTVMVEPGEETAKVTYTANDLDAPPGTLFVLETNLEAPPDANLTPTDTGVIVENGSMQAEYSATGPVTVDGEEAWAQRSIFVDGDDRVRVLLAYPAGDDIEHDPTVAVQSTATEVAERLAASPYAVLIGAGLAGMLVAGTVLHRRRQRP